MSGVIEAILKELERIEDEGKTIERVNEVILEIGEFTLLGSEQLTFCYKILTQENKLKGSTLIITKVQGEVACKQCDYHGSVEYFTEFHLETPILTCPKCRSMVKIVKGRECSVRSVNLEIKDD